MLFTLPSQDLTGLVDAAINRIAYADNDVTKEVVYKDLSGLLLVRSQRFRFLCFLFYANCFR
jgi:hypothetical protein